MKLMGFLKHDSADEAGRMKDVEIPVECVCPSQETASPEEIKMKYLSASIPEST